MSIKTFQASLNGGDLVSPNNKLIFKIYGSADSYTSALHTSGSATDDADVSISGDVVTIANVDIGSETKFKITSIDEALNESEKSDLYDLEPTAFRRYLFNGDLVDAAGVYDATITGTVTAVADRNAVSAQAYSVGAGVGHYIDLGSIVSASSGISIAFWLQDVPTDLAADYIACVVTKGIYIGNKANSPATGEICLNVSGFGGVPFINSGVKSDGNHFICVTITPGNDAVMYVDDMATPKGSANISDAVFIGNYRLNSLTNAGPTVYDNMYIYSGVINESVRTYLKDLD